MCSKHGEIPDPFCMHCRQTADALLPLPRGTHRLTFAAEGAGTAASSHRSSAAGREAWRRAAEHVTATAARAAEESSRAAASHLRGDQEDTSCHDDRVRCEGVGWDGMGWDATWRYTA